MDTVTVMDTVVVFLGEASKSWLETNAIWLIPSITVFVTIIGIIVSAWISTSNTKKQIINSRESTEEQIKASIKSTNKQIENQNIEGRRPYVKIVKIGKSVHLNEPKYYINCKTPEHDSTSYINRRLEIKNIGYGPSENIIVKTKDEIPIEKNQFIFDVATNGITDKSDTTVSLGVNESGNLNLEVFVAGPEKYRPKYIDIIILYSDLLDNIYQTNARIGLTHRLKSSQYVEKSNDWEMFFNDDDEKDYKKRP